MKKLILSMTIISSMMFFGVLNASAQGRRGPRRGPGKRFGGGYRGKKFHNMKKHRKGGHFARLEKLKRFLNLNPNQILKIMKIKMKYFRKDLNYKKAIAPLRITLKILMFHPKPNIKKIEKQMMLIARYRVSKRILKISQRLEVEKMLNPMQKTKFRFMLMMHHGKNKRKH
jgi:hypothetical protein